MCCICVGHSTGVTFLWSYGGFRGLTCEPKLTQMNVEFQVEQQFSHKFTVTVVRAASVTKGALGDLCEFCQCFASVWVILTFKTF